MRGPGLFASEREAMNSADVSEPGEYLRPGETLDELRAGGLRIIQGERGYRFSIDPILLCGFSRVEKGETAVDLGTGSGVIPLVMARRSGSHRLVGIECQGGLADRARRSVRLNALEDRVRIVEADLRKIGDVLPRGAFDVVLSNPPFRATGTGRQAPLSERAAARHELAGGIDDFLAAAAFLLREKGRVYLIFLAERLVELLETMHRHQLEPKRLRAVHSRAGTDARMVLVEGRKGGRAGMTIEAPLYVYENQVYSSEVAKLYEV
jgi:tRNA1Val (adenine37-N6)-methyltransferase